MGIGDLLGEGELLPVCGSADGYVESLDPLTGKEGTERERALRSLKEEMRARAHRKHNNPPESPPHARGIISSRARRIAADRR
jgi:hypothetical protein